MTAPLKRMVRSAGEYRQHAHAIAKAYGVRVLEISDLPVDDAGASPDLRAIRVRTITDDASYAVAMHELGHLCALNGAVHERHEFQTDLSLVLVEERAAWEWAEHYAIDWTTGMEQAKRLALTTYVENRRQNEVMGQLMAEIEGGIETMRTLPARPAGPAKGVGAASTFASKIQWHS